MIYTPGVSISRMNENVQIVLRTGLLKVKISLSLTNYHAMKIYGAVEV
jgi:hypothetical protein